MLILEEKKLKTLTTLVNKTDLVHRIRGHLEASAISEHLYNPDLSSVLALLPKLCKPTQMISPPQNRGAEKEGQPLPTIFLTIVSIELLFPLLSSCWADEQAQALRKIQVPSWVCELEKPSPFLSLSLCLENKIFKSEAKLVTTWKNPGLLNVKLNKHIRII